MEPKGNRRNRRCKERKYYVETMMLGWHVGEQQATATTISLAFHSFFVELLIYFSSPLKLLYYFHSISSLTMFCGFNFFHSFLGHFVSFLLSLRILLDEVFLLHKITFERYKQSKTKSDVVASFVVDAVVKRLKKLKTPQLQSLALVNGI